MNKKEKYWAYLDVNGFVNFKPYANDDAIMQFFMDSLAPDSRVKAVFAPFEIEYDDLTGDKNIIYASDITEADWIPFHNACEDWLKFNVWETKVGG